MSNCYDSDENYASSSQSKSSYKYSGDNRIYGDGSGRTAHRAKLRLNKIAARWPVMAVAQFYFIGN